MELIVVNTGRTEQPVKMEDKDGNVTRYTIVEMSGLNRDRYLNATNKRMETRGGMQVIKDYNGSLSCLLSHCMLDEDGKTVEEKIIQSWPVSVQEQLHKAASEINRLNKIGSQAGMAMVSQVMASDEDQATKLEMISQIVGRWQKGELKDDGETDLGER